MKLVYDIYSDQPYLNEEEKENSHNKEESKKKLNIISHRLRK